MLDMSDLDRELARIRDEAALNPSSVTCVTKAMRKIRPATMTVGSYTAAKITAETRVADYRILTGDGGFNAVARAVRRRGIVTFGDFCQLTVIELLGIPGVGPSNFESLMKVLDGLKISLAPDSRPLPAKYARILAMSGRDELGRLIS